MHGLRAGRHPRVRIFTIPTLIPVRHPVRHPVRPLPLRDPAGLAVAVCPEAQEPRDPGQSRQQEWRLEYPRRAQAIPVVEVAVAAGLRVAVEEEDGELTVLLRSA